MAPRPAEMERSPTERNSRVPQAVQGMATVLPSVIMPQPPTPAKIPGIAGNQVRLPEVPRPAETPPRHRIQAPTQTAVLMAAPRLLTAAIPTATKRSPALSAAPMRVTTQPTMASPVTSPTGVPPDHRIPEPIRSAAPVVSTAQRTMAPQGSPEIFGRLLFIMPQPP